MKAYVYRNLNNGLWSIKQRIEKKWVVVGHCKSCTLIDVTVRQSENARQTVIANNERSVHCWAIGELISVNGFQSFSGRNYSLTEAHYNRFPSTVGRQVTYNPKIHKTLVYSLSGDEYTGSRWAIFNDSQKMMVTQ